MGRIVDKLKGRVKEAAGSLLDDDDLKRKGRADQTAGEAKEKAEHAVDKAKEFVTGEAGDTGDTGEDGDSARTS